MSELNSAAEISDKTLERPMSREFGSRADENGVKIQLNSLYLLKVLPFFLK
jgi:hypothetical protein